LVLVGCLLLLRHAIQVSIFRVYSLLPIFLYGKEFIVDRYQYRIINNMSIRTEKQIEREKNTTKTSMRIDTKVFFGVKHLGLDLRKGISELTEEALRDLLVKYGYGVRENE
jgi:endonuclease III-like uncharacterized protein